MILAATGLQRERRMSPAPASRPSPAAAIRRGWKRARPARRRGPRHHQHRHRRRAGAGIAGRATGSWPMPCSSTACRCRPIRVDEPAGRRLPEAAKRASCSARCHGGGSDAERPRCIARPAPSRSTWNRMSRRGWRSGIACPSPRRALSPMPRIARCRRRPRRHESGWPMDLPAVLRSLAGEPGPASRPDPDGPRGGAGFRALLRGHRRLGAGLGGPDLGQLPLDMA